MPRDKKKIPPIIDPWEQLKELKDPTRKFIKRFLVEGYVVPKQRPRVTRRGTYMPKKYRDCKDSLALQFMEQAGSDWQSVKECEIDFKFVGMFRGDLDNVCGTVLDVMVGCGLIVDDRISLLKGGSWRHYKTRNKVPFTVVDIYILECNH